MSDEQPTQTGDLGEQPEPKIEPGEPNPGGADALPEEEDNTPADLGRALLPLGDDLLKNLESFWVVRDGRGGGTGQDQVPGPARRDVLAKRLEYARVVLQPVPARDLHQSRLRRVERVAACRPAARRIAATADCGSSWFFAENASIDGGMITARSRSRSSQTKASREKT